MGILVTPSRELTAEYRQALASRPPDRANLFVQNFPEPEGDCVDADDTIELEPLYRDVPDQSPVRAGGAQPAKTLNSVERIRVDKP